MALITKYLRVQIFQNIRTQNVKMFSFSKMAEFRRKNAVLRSNIRSQTLNTTPVYFKRRKTKEEKNSPKTIQYPPKSKAEIVDVWRGITLKELAGVLKRDVQYVKDLFLNRIDNAHTPIDDMKVLQEAIRRSGKKMQIVGRPTDTPEEEIVKDLERRSPPKKEELKPRPPIVTVMGHVDHGKTTLLDALRHSSVVETEFGGITQHIGAFLVSLESGAEITFLDTPGHAAFSSMRARGANLTDIVVLVVAADDGVMEQTLESIKMARDARVPVLVAINKIDSPKADIERTEKMLLQVGLQIEKFGGDVQAIPISALKKINLNLLTEALILQADLLNIGADPTGPVEAIVVESNVHPYRGKLTTVVVQRGTLKKGDILVAGIAMGKVRSIKTADGKSLEELSPGYPAEIDGWKDLPSAGDLVLEAQTEKEAKKVIRFRESELEKKKMEEDLKVIRQKQESHEREYKEKLQLKRQLGRHKLKPDGPRKPEIQEDNGPPSVHVIIKADVDGTLEAILDILDTYESEDCKLDIVSYGVGSITPNDIELAQTFNCVIYAFNVNVPNNLQPLMKENNINIKHFNVIYKLIDDFKEEVNNRLPLKEIEETFGTAEVLKQFEISQGRKSVPTAGCKCTEGVLKREALFRLTRNGEVIYEGPLASMRHLKSEVDIIKADTECGLQLSNTEITFEKGDILTCFEKKMVTQKTDWDPGF